jgi:uncharacterized protein YukE
MQVGNQFLGMSIDEVRATSGQMEQAATRINDVVTRLTAALGSTEWKGNDAERFRSAWSNTHAPALRGAATDIRSSAAQVRQNVEAQIRTSQRS